MPYEEEESSLKASGNFNKIISEDTFFNSLKYNNDLNNKIIHALKESKENIFSVPTKKSDIFDKLYCIDGSFLNISKNDGEVIALRVGAAILKTQDLFNIERNSFGTPNPFAVAQIYQNENNLFMNGILPSKNTYFYDNQHFLSMKETFNMSLDNMFEQYLAKNIQQDFFYDLYNHNLSKSIIKNLTEFKPIKDIIEGIREDSIIFNTQKEVAKIMLITESILSQYLLNKTISDKEHSLIVLDGRLQNEYLGTDLKELNQSKIKNINNVLIGVQKTGRLNILLTYLHQIIKNNDLSLYGLDKLHSNYQSGKSILIILNSKFKSICGLPKSGHGNYGIDCFYITQEPNRKEFVFTLPIHLFEQKSFDTNQLFKSLSSVFQYANTDLYILNKGVLISNILAHSNVALNKKYTKILGDKIETTEKIKPSAKMKI